MAIEDDVREVARELGRRGGQVSSEAKTLAVRKNGKLGGRPLKHPKCTKYKTHSFSPWTGRCPCGFVRPLSDEETELVRRAQELAGTNGSTDFPVRRFLRELRKIQDSSVNPK